MQPRIRRVFLILILIFAAVLQIHGINKLVLGSDELHPARALISSDWSITQYPWPEDANLEFYKDWPMHFPPLFALMTRLSVVVLGVSHISLRLFPLIFMLIATPLSYFIYKRYFGNKWALGAPILLGLVSEQTLTWAKALKHYTADILFCSLLLFIGKRLIDKNEQKDWIYFTLLAAVGFWVGYGSIFVSASIFFIMFIKIIYKYKRDRTDLPQMVRRFVSSAAIVCVSFVGLQYIAINMAVENPVFMNSFGIQIFRWSRAVDFGYILHFFGRVGFQTLLLPKFFFKGSTIICVIANILIFYWLIINVKEKKWNVIALILLPLIFCVGASIAGKYPFTANRLLLFLLN